MGGAVQEYSYAFWIQPTGIEGNWGNVFHRGARDWGNRAPAMYFYPGSTRITIRQDTNWGLNLGVNPARHLPMNQWTHVAVSVGQGVMRIWLNGILAEAVSIGPYLSQVSGPLWGGSPWWPSAKAQVADFQYFAGCLLGHPEVQHLYVQRNI